MLKLLFSIAAAAVLSVNAHAATQDRAAPAGYPTKPIRMVMPFSSGGGTDIVGRLLAKEMGELLGQPVVADNRTGAGGLIGIELVAHAAPDGYTLIFSNQSIATNESVHKKLGYNSLRDFAPVSRVSELQFILSVHPSLPVNSVKELTAYVKARPGKLTYASGGLGGVLFFAAEMYKNLAGLDILHVPYRGGGEATTAVLANQVSMVYTAVPVGMTHIQAGRLKGLAIAGTQRSPLAPQIPTMAEAGVAGYEFSVWNMLLAPTGTPRPILARLHQAVVKSLQAPALQESFTRLGVLPGASASPDDARRYFAAEVERYAKLVKQIGLKAE